MAYIASDYQDLIETTLRHLDKVKWTDLVVDLQRHTAMPQLLKKNRVEFGSGHGHQFNLRVDSNNAARNVKLNEEDNPTTTDTQIRGQIDWRHSETHWAIEERIIAMNREPARLVNLLCSAVVATSIAASRAIWASALTLSWMRSGSGLPFDSWATRRANLVPCARLTTVRAAW